MQNRLPSGSSSTTKSGSSGSCPADPPGAEQHQSGRFGLLLVGIGDMQVNMEARVILRRRLAELERDRRSGPVRRHEHLGPSAESILAQFIAQRR